jgi:hypothetical protein
MAEKYYLEADIASESFTVMDLNASHELVLAPRHFTNAPEGVDFIARLQGHGSQPVPILHPTLRTQIVP